MTKRAGSETIPSADTDVEQLELAYCWWRGKMAQPLWKSLALSCEANQTLPTHA